jgi:hypothetical protein
MNRKVLLPFARGEQLKCGSSVEDYRQLGAPTMHGGMV